ncbi:2-C-methyl-D-erythritol 4-phosphate cytidylyltransferase [bacterium]|nr:2-C-methyl-D-erythritol 4-phosphate cytidylyltransferase [bacterium]
MSPRRYTLIVTAAGSGQRYGRSENKIFERIAGLPTVIHAINNAMAADTHDVIVTCSSRDLDALTTLLNDHSIQARIVLGGSTRLESVQAALRIVSPESDGVLIHDAARPNPTPQLIHRLVDAGVTHSAVIPAISVTDTIKEVKDHWVQRTVPRQSLMAVQTPQLYSRDLLPILLQIPPTAEITDEAMALELQGIPIWIVAGSPHNIKLTHPTDKLILEVLMAPASE